MGGGRYDYLTAVGGGGANSGVTGSTACVPDNLRYGRFDTDPSGGMAPEYTQAPSPSFYR